MAKSPAFQLYPQDFLADINVQLMTTEELGAYFKLLMHDWIEDGIPNDDAKLARLTNLHDRWDDVKANVRICFEIRGERLFNPRLDQERNKQSSFRENAAAPGEGRLNPKRRYVPPTLNKKIKVR